jgi:energy-coupling factor transporter ATP-binding protein EcfA2
MDAVVMVPAEKVAEYSRRPTAEELDAKMFTAPAFRYASGRVVSPSPAEFPGRQPYLYADHVRVADRVKTVLANVDFLTDAGWDQLALRGRHLGVISTLVARCERLRVVAGDRSSQKSLILTGAKGSGKSTLLRHVTAATQLSLPPLSREALGGRIQLVVGYVEDVFGGERGAMIPRSPVSLIAGLLHKHDLLREEDGGVPAWALEGSHEDCVSPMGVWLAQKKLRVFLTIDEAEGAWNTTAVNAHLFRDECCATAENFPFATIWLCGSTRKVRALAFAEFAGSGESELKGHGTMSMNSTKFVAVHLPTSLRKEEMVDLAGTLVRPLSDDDLRPEIARLRGLPAYRCSPQSERLTREPLPRDTRKALEGAYMLACGNVRSMVDLFTASDGTLEPAESTLPALLHAECARQSSLRATVEQLVRILRDDAAHKATWQQQTNPWGEVVHVEMDLVKRGIVERFIIELGRRPEPTDALPIPTNAELIGWEDAGFFLVGPRARTIALSHPALVVAAEEIERASLLLQPMDCIALRLPMGPFVNRAERHMMRAACSCRALEKIGARDFNVGHDPSVSTEELDTGLLDATSPLPALPFASKCKSGEKGIDFIAVFQHPTLRERLAIVGQSKMKCAEWDEQCKLDSTFTPSEVARAVGLACARWLEVEAGVRAAVGQGGFAVRCVFVLATTYRTTITARAACTAEGAAAAPFDKICVLGRDNLYDLWPADVSTFAKAAKLPQYCRL